MVKDKIQKTETIGCEDKEIRKYYRELEEKELSKKKNKDGKEEADDDLKIPLEIIATLVAETSTILEKLTML